MNDVPKKLTAWLTINRSCNLRCRWCYAKMTGFEKDNMSFQTLKNSLDLFQALGTKSVIILGGEPTIHPEFNEFLKRIKERNMVSYLVTNAVVLSDQKVLESIKENGVDAVTVSLKAFNRQDYFALTGLDAFVRVKNAIQNLQHVGLQNVVNVTLSKETIETIDQLIELLGETGAKIFSLDTGKPVFLPDGSTNAEGMGSLEDLAYFFISTYDKLKKSGFRFTLKIAIPFCLFPEDFIQTVIADGNLLTGCQMATGRGIIVDPKGYIIPCNHLCNFSLGNVSDVNSLESFQSFRMDGTVEKFYQKVSTCPSTECVGCKHWKICGAGCRLYWLHYGRSIKVRKRV